jgi:flagellar biosynthesis/type III secretory pathway chaperone
MSIFGKGLVDYHKDMEQMRREHEEQLKLMDYESQRRMMMDNRAIPSRVPSVEELYENVKRANQITKDLMHKIDRTEKKVEMLTGFYTWITEVYPEIAAQHKAMRDLYEAANPTQTEAGP